MNMAYTDYDERDLDYRVPFERRSIKERIPRKGHSFRYARTNRAATSYNGIHRRRNKRFTW